MFRKSTVKGYKISNYLFFFDEWCIIDKNPEQNLVIQSIYSPPPLLFNGHIETIYPALFRKINNVKLTRERITTPDQDFVDLDWLKTGSEELVIICHGLEGDSQQPYMLGMTRAVSNLLKHDALAWNYRGCSGEINLHHRFYHSGATDDLDVVVKHAMNQGYQSISLIGFSLGGNLVLKYLGEIGADPAHPVTAGVVFSVPLDLEASSKKMMKWYNYVYSQRFMKSLKNKVKQKKGRLPEHISLEQIDKVRHVFHFDDLFTAPIHGFRDARDYYKSCSSLFFLNNIRKPVLIVNARNDPFLDETCFPFEKLADNQYIYFEAPERGGHCGFASFETEYYWSERRAVQFLSMNKPVKTRSY